MIYVVSMIGCFPTRNALIYKSFTFKSTSTSTSNETPQSRSLATITLCDPISTHQYRKSVSLLLPAPLTPGTKLYVIPRYINMNNSYK